ncbi:Oidioi.mRNA.OKI2018_I69.chr2.g6855.t1.cds [Oikopleura dioica]|uniref:Oidioi.mRNA.OKI2018_I69.chr2.g6855.t1.cds n=1 Tax=Oikopleura dioica TaxID=34765 RepID=A0ABN7T7V2_OIKDI|nr:Oidioi.mRNA.OKI2018_I69.chr2.g6855.t1.cds [Oikopleura dioica]
MEYGDILNNEAKMKESRDKAYDFQRDPFRTRNSRPEAKFDLSGNETLVSYRKNKKSLLHRFLEKRGLLSPDPYLRMHQKMRYERFMKIGAFVGITSMYLITSVVQQQREDGSKPPLMERVRWMIKDTLDAPG